MNKEKAREAILDRVQKNTDKINSLMPWNSEKKYLVGFNDGIEFVLMVLAEEDKL
ncbi:MAG: hypothetical protein GXZ11_05735 [Tissierellia bacterium]|nr:hypothetical protein [Tissierellia bacterium]